ncbi:MAG: universal stress protein [Bacteroidales bacterium]|nr:universal stress protein [Bacteroidales bacterium]
MESKVLKKILVPVDYSEYSLQAAKYALRIAHKAGAEIMLFHSFYSPAYDLIELTGNKETQEKLREELTNKLLLEEKVKMDEFAQTVQKIRQSEKYNIEEIHYEVQPGLAKDQISLYCTVYKPNLVVMGTRGTDKRDQSILGSVTEYALMKLRYPLLTVPEEHHTKLGEVGTEVVYLTDFDESDFVSIKRLMSYFIDLEPSIHCLHIGDTADKSEKAKMEGLKNYFSYAYPLSKIEYEVIDKEGDLVHSVEQYLKKKSINILSLTSRKRNALEKLFSPSLTKRLFHNLNIPLFVFHN